MGFKVINYGSDGQVIDDLSQVNLPQDLALVIHNTLNHRKEVGK